MSNPGRREPLSLVAPATTLFAIGFWHMKTPIEGLKCLGRKEISYLISYVVLFCDESDTPFE
jgi:hypothetical protein